MINLIGKALDLALFSGFLFAGCQAEYECPTKDSLKANLKDFIPGQFEVESVQPLKEMPSVYEIVPKGRCLAHHLLHQQRLQIRACGQTHSHC